MKTILEKQLSTLRSNLLAHQNTTTLELDQLAGNGAILGVDDGLNLGLPSQELCGCALRAREELCYSLVIVCLFSSQVCRFGPKHLTNIVAKDDRFQFKLIVDPPVILHTFQPYICELLALRMALSMFLYPIRCCLMSLKTRSTLQ